MKTLGMLLMVIGVAGFFGANVLKSKSQVLEEKVSREGRQVVELAVNADKSYTVFLWGRTEEGESTPGWADLEYGVRIVGVDGATALFTEESLVATSSGNGESGGVKRAQIGCEYTGTPRTNGVWRIEVDLRDGDEVTVDAYEGLSVLMNLAPGLGILCGIVGVVLFLRGRAPR